MPYLPSDAQNVVEVAELGKQLQRCDEQRNFPFFTKELSYLMSIVFFSDACMVQFIYREDQLIRGMDVLI